MVAFSSCDNPVTAGLQFTKVISPYFPCWSVRATLPNTVYRRLQNLPPNVSLCTERVYTRSAFTCNHPPVDNCRGESRARPRKVSFCFVARALFLSGARAFFKKRDSDTKQKEKRARGGAICKIGVQCGGREAVARPPKRSGTRRAGAR
jgi:hypothetical protein